MRVCLPELEIGHATKEDKEIDVKHFSTKLEY